MGAYAGTAAASRGFRFLARLPLRRATLRLLGRGLVVAGAVWIVALEAGREGLLPRPPRAEVAVRADDPVMAEVGPLTLRLSDVRAQAGPERAEAPAEVLEREGHLADAASQLALALAAEEQGLDRALEVRARLALARRYVLAEAYLEQAVARAVTEEAVRAAYEAELAALGERTQIALRHILVSSQEEAQGIADRIARGASFAEMAQRLSLDMETRKEGGSFGLVQAGALAEGLREAARGLAIGTVSAPLRTGAGWHLVRVDARRELRPPPYIERKPAIEAALGEEAIAAAVAAAQAHAAPETAAGRAAAMVRR